jgi:ribonuclease P protein component
MSPPGDDPAVPTSPGPGVPARAGFVVPKTVGNAVTRNKVRRRLREMVRVRLADLGPGSAVVIRALPGAADRSFAELAADLDGALATARTRRPRRRPGGSS